MVIDASALVAILLGEPEAGRFLDVLDACAETLMISPVSVFETVAAIVRVTGCPVIEARVSVSAALKEYGITNTEISMEAGEEAITAFDRFGKGRHPAQLNMGDCFSYALAKTMRSPILFKGDDFSRTDLEAAG
jgi:ribonuclease VapC